MIKLTLSILTVVILGFGAGIVGADDPMSDKEAKPTLGERFTKGMAICCESMTLNRLNSINFEKEEL